MVCALIDSGGERTRNSQMLNKSRTAFVKLKPLKLHPSTGVRLSPKYGQHLTINPGVVDTMIQAADIRSTDTVLEIGCGSGNITMKLLPIARKVIVIELDTRFAEETEQRAIALGFDNLEVIKGDATKVSYPSFDVCVANPSYNISSLLIFKLAANPYWRRSILMLQKEFADRLVADPGNKEFSRLSMNASLYFRTERVMKVSGGSFYPQSAVQSMIVRLIPRFPRPTFDFREWDGLMRILFLQRRRALHAVLSKPQVMAMLEVNYKTWCVINERLPALMSFPDYVLSTLEELRVDRICAKKISAEKMQKILQAFHAKGLFFSSVAAEPVQAVKSFEDGILDALEEGEEEGMNEEECLNGS